MAVTMESTDLQKMLQEAARIGGEIGAKTAIDDLVCYHLKDACRQLNMSYNTLQKRISEGKITPVDGRITGGEIRRYLTKSTN